MPWWIFKGLIYLHEWQLQREQQLKEKANEWGTSTTAYPAECCNSCNWTRPNPGSSSSTCTSHRWQGLKHLGHSLPSSHTTSKELNRKRGRWDTRMMASQMAALHAGPECRARMPALMHTRYWKNVVWNKIKTSTWHKKKVSEVHVWIFKGYFPCTF